jgi:broad specificity phosphatase PhoE
MKTPRRIRFIRHGQSEFNAAFERIRPKDPMIFDARLTEKGRGQAIALSSQGLWHDVQLVVTSPLTRAIETTLLAFAGVKAPIRVEALHRERVEHSGDIGRPRPALETEFGHLEFSDFPEYWWHHEPGKPMDIAIESEDALRERVANFRAFLAARPERHIAVVGHGTFLNRLTGHSFANCEVLERDDF